MPDLLLQLLALMILLGGIGIGYWFWARPYMSRVGWRGKGLLLLLVVTGVGGFLGSPFWWLDLKQSFSWDLPPLASRLLAAASVAFGVGCYLALRRPTVRRVRLVLLLTVIYLMPLVVAVLLFHLDRFDFAASLTYGFFVLAVGIGLAATIYLIRQPVIVGDESRDTVPASSLAKAWLVIVGVLLGTWGLALLLTDFGPSDLIWVWPGDLLTSRLIAVMLLAISVTAFYSVSSKEATLIQLPLIIVYGLGVVAANLWNPAAIKVLYLSVFGLLALVSALIFVNEKGTR